MALRLHLVSPPWQSMSHASAAIGALKAHIDQVLPDKVESFCYSAHLDIPYRLLESSSPVFAYKARAVGEYISFLLFQKRYLSVCKAAETKRILDCINRELGEEHQLTPALLSKLEDSFISWLDEVLLPNVAASQTNIIGFSVTFPQVYSAAFMIRYLAEKRPSAIAPLYLFGGYAASQPGAQALLRRLSIAGYVVLGEGEPKLERILASLLAGKARIEDGCLRLLENIPGVFRIGEEVVPASHEQIPSMSSLPIPAYEDYFKLVRRLSAADPVFGRLLKPVCFLEGSRGCYKSCDFCNLNFHWSGYRFLKGTEVAKRAIELAASCGIRDVSFADTICNPWAEEFADALLERGADVKFFMELRVKSSERFWAKLSLAGLQTVQLGVESLSTSLLKKMNKGITAMENLACQKYIRELGIRSISNLIVHYPGSTVEEIEQTRKLASVTLHFGAFQLNPFHLVRESPVYNRLSEAEKSRLRPDFRAGLPRRLQDYYVAHGLVFAPGMGNPDKVRRAWDRFIRWYRAEAGRVEGTGKTLGVWRQPDGTLSVTDSRFGRKRTVKLAGDRARLYDRCHVPATIPALQKELGLRTEEIESIVRELENDDLLVCVDDQYLSLALRPAAELLLKLAKTSEKALPELPQPV